MIRVMTIELWSWGCGIRVIGGQGSLTSGMIYNNRGVHTIFFYCSDVKTFIV